MAVYLLCSLALGIVSVVAWRPWDGATAGMSAGLCATPGCGGAYTESYSVQACINAGYRLEGVTVIEPDLLPHPFGQGAQPALNECSNPGELRLDLCPNILKFANIWQPEVDGRTFGGVGDAKLIQGFGHAFTKVADGLPCGYCAAVRAKRVLTDGGYNYMIIMRVDVTDDISPEVDEVTAEFGEGVVLYPEADRIPYEYKLVSCMTGTTGESVGSPSPMPPIVQPTQVPVPTQAPAPIPTQQATPAPTLAPTNELAEECLPEGDCSKNTLCSTDWTVYCSSLRSTCPKPYCKRGGASVPTLTPSTPASVPSTCVVEADCSKNSFCSVDWTTYCRAASSACPAPFCKRASLLQAAPISRHLRSSSRQLQPDTGGSLIQQHQQLNIAAQAVEPEVQITKQGLEL